LKYAWLLSLPVLCSTAALPAAAAEIVSWQFDPIQNRIDFTTDGEIKPQAQLIANPSRLIVDLPNTSLRRPTQTQALSGNLKSLRVGQLDESITRMVLELSPGYGIDPQQVSIQANNAKQWSVQIPTPQAIQTFSGGAPTGQIPVYTQNGKIVPATPKPKVALDPYTASLNYIAVDPTKTGILLQADRSNKFLLKYTTAWDIQTGSYKIIIPNARLAPNYQIPIESQRFLRVGTQGNDVYVLVRQTDGLRVNIVRQYLENRWVYLQSVPSTTRVATRPAVDIPVPRPSSTSTPRSEPKQDNSPPIQTNGRVMVVIDPGHGGRDPGAIGIGELKEVDVIMPISRRVADILQSKGIAVKMTRTSDYYVGLDERVSISRQAGGTLFVSIHANSIDGRPDVNGLEVYHYNIGQSLAESVHNATLDYVNKNGFYLGDRRVRSARFLVLRKSSIPAILVETGYLTSEAEAARLRNPEYQKVMAEGIARGIIQYIKERN
jgi:N-acetylmuramoyl-L-alanine amidase